MRWVLVLGVVSALTLAHVAGSATSTRYVLWSTRTAGGPAAPVRVLPADLPDDRQLGAPADLLDRTAAGRVAVASIDELVIENVDGSARAVVPLSGVYDGRFSPDGSMLVLASFTCAYSDSRCERVSVVDSDGGNLRLLADHAGAARWIGNGLLAYVGAVASDGIGTLKVADPNGRAVRVLGKSFAFPAPAPSPNGRLIVDQCRTQLICVRGTSLPGRVVAHFRGALVETPLWSPDGSSVALTLSGNYTTTTAVGSVKTAALDQISSPTYIGTDDAVDAWAPDTSTILVQRRCSGGLLIGQTPCRDQAFSETLSTHQRHRLLTHGDQRWESARWTKTSLTYITPPSG